MNNVKLPHGSYGIRFGNHHIVLYIDGKTWIGARDEEGKGAFKWVNNGEAILYTNWAPNTAISDSGCLNKRWLDSE